MVSWGGGGEKMGGQARMHRSPLFLLNVQQFWNHKYFSDWFCLWVIFEKWNCFLGFCFVVFLVYLFGFSVAFEERICHSFQSAIAIIPATLKQQLCFDWWMNWVRVWACRSKQFPTKLHDTLLSDVEGLLIRILWDEKLISPSILCSNTMQSFLKISKKSKLAPQTVEA